VIYEGKEVKTGIFKKPAQSEILISKTGITGDEQADLKNHGGLHKAVYAFSADHYRYWETLLGHELPYGVFGENFTVTNLSEETICIGDRLSFGTALLEVSQPRIPCFKLGIALKNKNAPKLFTQSCCSGVYFRVLEPGVVKAGEAVLLQKRADHGISVKKLFQAYFDKGYRNSESIFSAAYVLDELAPAWKKMLAKKLAIK